MSTNIRKSIDKNTYENYLSLDKKSFLEEVEATIPIEWKLGYGWYGARLEEKNGEYFIIHTIGSTCD